MEFLKRIASLRSWMDRNGFKAFIIPSTDPHQGEYIPAHWEARAAFSGFTGSAGTIVVTMDDGALWTDSRYFIQASQQLEPSGFRLMRMGQEGTPSIAQWLGEVLADGQKAAIVGEMADEDTFRELGRELGGIRLESVDDPFGCLWDDRPQLPDGKITIHPAELAGESVQSKLSRIREFITSEDSDNFLITMLDDIAWTTNLRGHDVHCTPVFVAYLVVSRSSCSLYTDPSKLSAEVAEYLVKENITAREYKEIFRDISMMDDILLDRSQTNHAIYMSISPSCRKKECSSPVTLWKTYKNEAEIRGYHNAMLRDGVAMVKFLRWLVPAVREGGQTELSVSDRLESFRAEQDMFDQTSFDTISAYAHHGAIVHYEPTRETDIPLKAEGFLLLDSGAQYHDGTTDITRTIPLGPASDEMRLDYTLVLKGFIDLGLAVFPSGCSGTQLDVLARQAMWASGKNFGHGTGHGVGSYLSVHEGPHQIRMNWKPAPLKAAMTVTDEPGLYIEGKYGIRTENTLLIVPCMRTGYGEFLRFEHLTLCPISTEPVIIPMLTDVEKEWLNSYHETVYEKLSPYLTNDEAGWLREATRPI